MDRNLYTVKQVADMFGMHPKTIRRYIQSGTLKARKIGKEWRILESELKAFLDSNEDFKTQHLEKALQEINDFIYDEGIQQTGTTQTLAITDIFMENSEKAKELCEELIKVVKTNGDETSRSKFKYFFIEETKKARFILTGSPKYVSSMLEIIQSKNK